MKYSSYPELEKIIGKRRDAYLEGKVSRTYLNKICFMYEESTDENGDKLKCNICLGELENDTEVCRLPCGHINCKNCIEGWFEIENDEHQPSTGNQTLQKHPDDTNIDRGHGEQDAKGERQLCQQ